MSGKIREILPKLNDAVIKLANMNILAAKLEYFDNDNASREFRKALIEFENNDIKKLKEIAVGIREVVRTKPKRDYDSSNNYLKNKYKQPKTETNESDKSESEQ